MNVATTSQFSNYSNQLRIEFYSRFDKKIPTAYKWNDFKKIKIVGEGAFGKVYLAQHLPTGTYYAMKQVEKGNIVRTKQTEHSKNEKKVLEAIRFPFVVHMECFFKDNDCLYFMLPFANGGDMFTHLGDCKHFDETRSKFYAAQVILALEYLHNCDLIYRDLKPENVMIDIHGYVKLTDFGFCKLMTKVRTWTLCGTPYYIAPELLLMKGYGTSADWWSFGILVYEMNAGQPPFNGYNHMKIYEKIIKGKFKCPGRFSRGLTDFLKGIIELDITKRLGCMKNGSMDLKNHKWLESTNWLGLLEYKVPAPFVPAVISVDDTRYFDDYDDISLKQSSQCQFESIFEDF